MKTSDLLNPNKDQLQLKVADIDAENEKPIDAKPRAGLGTIATHSLLNSIPQTIGMLEGLGEAGVKKLAGSDESFLSLLGNSVGMKASNAIDEKTREWMNVPEYEDMTRTEQAAALGGDLIPIFASGGSYGAVKVGSKLTNKAVKSTLKKQLAKGVSKEVAKKAARRTGAIVNTASDMLMPGVQISKQGSTLGKVVSGGIQTALPVGLSEYGRYTNSLQGLFNDYSDNKEPTYDTEINLINDRRKIGKSEYVKPENLTSYELDSQAEEDSFFGNMAKIGAGVAGVAAAINSPKALHYMMSKGLLKENKYAKMLDSHYYPTQEVVDNSVKTLKQQMTMNDRIKVSTMDRNTFMDVMTKNNELSENVANSLKYNTNEVVNNSWTSGKINFGDEVFDLGTNPQELQAMMTDFKNIDPKGYENLDKYLKAVSKLQDKVRTHNIGKVDTLSTDDYFAGTDVQKQLKSAREKLYKSPAAREIIGRISKLSHGLLDAGVKSGMFDEKTAELLTKNRTILGDMLYIPKQAKNERTAFEKVVDFVTGNDINPKHNQKLYTRSVNGLQDIDEYVNTIEKMFRHNVEEMVDNNRKVNFFQDAMKNQTKNINERLDKAADFVEQQDFKELYKSQKAVDDFKKKAKSLRDDVYKSFNINYLGSKSLDDLSIQEAPDLYKMLNTPEKNQNILSPEFVESKAHTKYQLMNAIEDAEDNVISYISKGRKHYFKVDPIIKKGLEVDSRLPNAFERTMSSMRRAAQWGSTSKVAAPFFSLKSFMYSTTEAMTMLPKLAKELGFDDKSYKLLWEYLKSIPDAAKDIKSEYMAKKMIASVRENLIRANNSKPLPSTMNMSLDDLEKQLNSSLKMRIEVAAGRKMEQFTSLSTGAKDYSIQTTTDLSKVTQLLSKFHTPEEVKKLANMFGMCQDVLRNSPNYALNKYLLKKSGAISKDFALDVKKSNKIFEKLRKYTTTTSTTGTGEGILGGTVKFISNYVPYGNISMKSAAAKMNAINWDRLGATINSTFDPHVRFIDKVSMLGKLGKDISTDEVMKGLYFTVGIPTMLSYMWNMSSPERRDAYANIPNYQKAQGPVFVNVFGTGKNVRIPVNQEEAIFSPILQGLIDIVFAQGNNNNADPNFSFSDVTSQAVVRSIVPDLPTGAALGLNMFGYDANINNYGTEAPVVRAIQPMGVVENPNDILSPKTEAILNTAFGAFGSMISSIIGESTKTSSISNNATSVTQVTADRLLSPAGLLSSTASSFNSTSAYTYRRQSELNMLGKFAKTSEQNVIYNFIKVYNKNRIANIHKQVSDLRKEIKIMQNYGVNSDGKPMTYSNRKQMIQDLNKQLNKLFTQEKNQFDLLDKSIQQLYGISYDDYYNQVKQNGGKI